LKNVLFSKLSLRLKIQEGTCGFRKDAVVVRVFYPVDSMGLYQGRKVKNNCDYAIAAAICWWAAALSERATGESSGPLDCRHGLRHRPEPRI